MTLQTLKTSIQGALDLESALLELRALTTDEDLIKSVVGKSIMSPLSMPDFIRRASRAIACGDDPLSIRP